MMAAPPGGAGGGGAGGGPPAEPVTPPTEAPDALRPFLDLLTKPLALILVAKQIPWVVQAKLAQEGYVTVEDLGGRWNTPQNPDAWAFKDPKGKAFCRDYHLTGTCPGSCGRSHNCPVRQGGWVSNASPDKRAPDECPHAPK